MTDTFRALCAELVDAWLKGDDIVGAMNRARAVLGEADEPAVPEGREPAAVTGQLSDEELLNLAQQYSVVYLLSDGSACHPFQEGYDMRNDVLNFARAVLARWGHQPAPPADGEVAECTAELEEQKPRPDYDRVQKIATEAQIRSAAQYLAKKQHCDGDLIPAIRYAIARWGNPAPQPAAVTGRPSDEELLDLLPQGNESGFWLPKGLPSDWVDGEFIAPPKAIIAFARDVLELWGNPAPPPADGEVAELPPRPPLMTPPVHPALERYGITWDGSPDKPLLTRMADGYWTPWHVAAELLQRLISPQPVPVSERLPGPEDMTDDGEVWIEDPGREYPLADAGDYDWEPHKWILRPIGKFDAQNGLRWLPAHALPLPEVDE